MILASVQTAADTAPLTFGRFLVMFGALLLLAVVLGVPTWLLLHLEDRTRYDEVEDAYPAERIPAGRSWK